MHPILLKSIQLLNFPKKNGVCERLFGRRLYRQGIAYIPTGAGLSWKLDLRSDTHRWIVYGQYDPSFVSWSKKYLKSDHVVVDSGANIGQTTMYLGQYVPKGKLYAFEPGQSARQWLAECVAKNQAKMPSVEVVGLGLGEKSQELFLEDPWGGERFHGAASQVSTQKGEAIRLVRLDDFLTERKVSSVHLWKLDVEGFEMPALKGASGFLKDQRIGALYVELYRRKGPEFYQNGLEIRRYLASFGYQCYVIKPYSNQLVLETRPTDTIDGLFLPGKAPL